MKKWLGVGIVIGAAIVLVVGAAVAQMGMRPWASGGRAPEWAMGPGGGPEPMWGYSCPGLAASTESTVNEDTAKQIAQKYAEQYLKGFTVDKVLPFTGMRGVTMYSVELKGPNGEFRAVYVNPWGGVMPFAGPWHRG